MEQKTAVIRKFRYIDLDVEVKISSEQPDDQLAIEKAFDELLPAEFSTTLPANNNG